MIPAAPGERNAIKNRTQFFSAGELLSCALLGKKRHGILTLHWRHTIFGNPSASAVVNVLRRTRPDEMTESMKQKILDISKMCIECSILGNKPKKFNLRVGADDLRFNQIVAVYLMYINSKPIIHVVHLATHYNSALFLIKVLLDTTVSRTTRTSCEWAKGPNLSRKNSNLMPMLREFLFCPNWVPFDDATFWKISRTIKHGISQMRQSSPTHESDSYSLQMRLLKTLFMQIDVDAVVGVHLESGRKIFRSNGAKPCVESNLKFSPSRCTENVSGWWEILEWTCIYCWGWLSWKIESDVRDHGHEAKWWAHIRQMSTGCRRATGEKRIWNCWRPSGTRVYGTKWVESSKPSNGKDIHNSRIVAQIYRDAGAAPIAFQSQTVALLGFGILFASQHHFRCISATWEIYLRYTRRQNLSLTVQSIWSQSRRWKFETERSSNPQNHFTEIPKVDSIGI